MDEVRTNPLEDDLAQAPETPEDVAVLYTWANVHGGKYRDFSASRREYRAQQRHRMMEAQRQAELEAARALQNAAARELDEARMREQEAVNEAARAQAEVTRRRAEAHASQERLLAQRHVETAEELKHALEQAQREMEEARRRADEQAARYAEADARLRASQNSERSVPGEIDDPYYYAGPLEPDAFAPGSGVRSSMPQRISSERRIVAGYRKQQGESDPAERRSEQSGVPKDSFYASGRYPWPELQDEPRRERQPHVDLPEDRRERLRSDEQERLSPAHDTSAELAEARNDPYYDHQPSQTTADLSRTANPSPRTYSLERSILRSEYPAPGNTHTLEPRRRRDSAADAATRTTRHPRTTDGVEHGQDSDGEQRDASDRVSLKPHDVSLSAAAHEGMPRARSGHLPVSSDQLQPEWLARDRAAETSEGAPADSDENERFPARGSRTEADRQPTAGIGDRDAGQGFTHIMPQFAMRGERDASRTAIPKASGRATPDYDDITRMMPSAENDETGHRKQGSIHLDASPERPPLGKAFSRMQGESKDSAHPRSEVSLLREVERGRGTFAGRDAFSWPGVFDTDEDASLEVERYDERLPRVRPEVREVSRREPRRRMQESTPELSLQSAAASQPTPFGAPAPFPTAMPRSTPSAADTLQQSRERVAARWFALKNVMNAAGEGSAESPLAQPRSSHATPPTLCVVSLCGGVGKTSLVATLGRALSASGEKVLLADTAAYGLLPYYFGARELRPAVVRTFSPPPGSADAPVYMVNYEADRFSHDEAAQVQLAEEIGQHARDAQRVLLDLSSSHVWLARRLARQTACILVPVAPDMNSVLGIQSMERLLTISANKLGKPVAPFYVLTQFDASLPLHLDVREVLRQQLGDRLLSIVIRRSPAVAEALAEGMTAIDYAPESPVTEDYIHLADWVRNLAAPATALPSTRWSER